jgi:hypothetical protein
MPDFIRAISSSSISVLKNKKIQLFHRVAFNFLDQKVIYVDCNNEEAIL